MRGLGENFNNKKPTKQVTIPTVQDENTTSRRVYPKDHRVLRELAFKNETNITQILEEVYHFVKPIIDQSGSYIIPEITDATKSSQHKAVRISNEFNDYLNDLSKKHKTDGRTVKQFLSVCLKYYVDNIQQK